MAVAFPPPTLMQAGIFEISLPVPSRTIRHAFPLPCGRLVTLLFLLFHLHSLGISTTRDSLQKKGEELLNYQSPWRPLDWDLRCPWVCPGITLGDDLTQAWLGSVKWLSLLFVTDYMDILIQGASEPQKELVCLFPRAALTKYLKCIT